MSTHFEASSDLGSLATGTAVALTVLALVLLVVELTRAKRARAVRFRVLLTGVLALTALLGAALRPISVETEGTSVGPRVVILVDESRSLDLPAGKSGNETRRAAAKSVVDAVVSATSDARHELLAFGQGPAKIFDPNIPSSDAPVTMRSDLTAALDSLQRGGREPPDAMIVVSDGRWDRPGDVGPYDRDALGLGGFSGPVHAVSVASEAPVDLAVSRVSIAGAAVAHQPVSLRIEVACTGGLSCSKVPVRVRELEDKEEPAKLADGVAQMAGGIGTVELSITLHRAGARVLVVEATAPNGDAIPENDRRFITVNVARDRVRVLHVAGRPTYDVRALRTWLKADASIDVVAFFILRTPTDNVGAGQSELALIPFPVDELFSVHLPSFDAVVLQDFNAEVYGLTKHLGSLARYVDAGGGLIMVGGPDAFGPGRYADSPLDGVLPVELTREHENPGVDLSWFLPTLTPAGRVAPALAPLRALVAEAFPEMPGTNLVGAAKRDATVLFSHPKLTAGNAPMPVLALGEHGAGRTIALTVDGTHRLLFSNFATETAGRAYGALWEGLLGWLMRDPRFESTVVDLPQGCVAGKPTKLKLVPLPGKDRSAVVKVLELGSGRVAFETSVPLKDDALDGTDIAVPALAEGGYATFVEISSPSGRAPATRRDFACEAGGDEWADTRPDPERMRAFATALGGKFVEAKDAGDLPIPPPTLVSSHRRARAILPSWGWTLSAAALLGMHWVVRRRHGLF